MGMKLMSDSLDTIGVMARCVADCALLTAALTGLDLGDPDAKPARPPRIGMCRTPMWDRAAPETRDVVRAVAGPCSPARGRPCTMLDLPPAFDRLEAAHSIVMQAESARAMGWEMTTARDQLSPGLRERLEWGLTPGGEPAGRARPCSGSCRPAFAAAVGACDLLLTPSAPGQAPVGLDRTGDPSFNLLWTSLHVPCVTVPAGAGPDGMPLGVQIVTRRGEDRQALAWAAWVAAALT